ncbi:MAG: hypothetical protein CL920_37425 [Deltaproteobacteria bacterium]|nr:hypothetical protein [Deltaproteobacteria bacterium]
MKTVQTKAVCRLCGKETTKGGMSRHLQKCILAHAPTTSKQETLYLLRVEGKEDPQYWMHLEIPASMTFGALDAFLRELWLECCGHMSSFDFGTKHAPPDFEYYWEQEDDDTMGKMLGDILSPKMPFHYEYDFGSSTLLTLQVVSERSGAPIRNTILLLARNQPPPLPCDCGKAQATEVCSTCFFYGTGRVCKACKKKHKCDGAAWLPVVNSPRIGTCAYGTEADEEAVMQNFEKKLPSAKNIAKYEEVRRLLRKHMTPYPESTLESALNLWDVYVEADVPTIRSAKVYAASVEYILGHLANFPVSQGKLAKKYNTTTTSISQTYNKIIRKVDTLRHPLEEDDDDFFFDESFLLTGQSSAIDTQALIQHVMTSYETPPELDPKQKSQLERLPLVDETWIGSRAAMPALLLESGSVEPEVCIWVHESGHPVFSHGITTPGDSGHLLLDLLFEAINKEEFGPPRKPARILIASEWLVEPLRAQLEPFDIEVDYGGDRIVAPIFSNMREHVTQQAPKPYLENKKTKAETVAALFQASAAFYQQKPWSVIGDMHPFCVDLRDWDLGEYSVCVMGAAGINIGILIFDTIDDYDQFYDFVLSMQNMMIPGSGFGVGIRAIDFENINEITKPQHQEWIKQGWEIANLQAYPDFRHMDPEMKIIPLKEDDFRIAIGCLWALADYKKEHKKHMQKANILRGQEEDLLTLTTEVPMFPHEPPIQVTLPHPSRIQKTTK